VYGKRSLTMMTESRQSSPDPDTFAAWLHDARARTLRLVADLTDEQLMGPRLPTVNPLLWEIGHVAWFQEKWMLRRAGQASVRADSDSLYDSAAIPHDVRWDLLLPRRSETMAYMQRVQDCVLDRIERGLGEEDAYFVQLAIFHEDMHAEAFAITRQALSYPAPTLPAPLAASRSLGPLPGDVNIPGGTYLLGAEPGEPFVFDNEKWAHPVEVAPFAIARAPVTQSVFASFVEEGGYKRQELWTKEGWAWRSKQQAEHPVYWRRARDGWERRAFDRWVSLEPHWPMVHVNWYEANAWCRWAGRRLATEAEWELAAASFDKRRFPWGDEPPTSQQANLDARRLECVDVGAFSSEDSPFGCRQMIGNVWEWTADAFGPYPGFVVDPYKEYSEPWFGNHMALRGGSWATPGRLLRNTWRNFYQPHRADMWAGFRTCALE
jgi:iron(II)-dependent oxidoreductase